MKEWKIGEIRNGFEVLSKDKRKTILLLCDDIRTHSGIATMGREFVFQTCHHINWVNLGALINHPEEGKIIDLSEWAFKETGVPDIYLKSYPLKGYGSPDIVRSLIERENIDAILHYTDPRFWDWLYSIEHEIRQHIPIFYYNIWDDLPYPHYNKKFYASSDLIMNISKQTVNIVKNVLGEENYYEVHKDDSTNNHKTPRYVDSPVYISYIPHGINPDIFRPIDRNDQEFVAFKETILKNKEYDFIIFYNNRNIRRKMPSDLMASYKFFCDEIGSENAEKCLLLYKTHPIDNNGTDLSTVYHDIIGEEYNVQFLHQSLSPKIMNFLYNMADVTMGVSSAEGFGLATAESIMAGTPIIVNSIGGLQDQCRFEDENGDWINFDEYHPTNSDKKYTKHGEWAFPVWPQINIMGSPPTPYIYDSRANQKDIAEQLLKVYNTDWIDRRSYALKGRTWMMSKECGMSATEMGQRFMNDMTYVFDHWNPRNRLNLYRARSKKEKIKTGLYNPIKDRWE
jgi:glycosyltransferase involved in cell wall biosynthesis